jgi:hypothetical protein
MTEAEKLIIKFKAQHELTLWRIEQENKLLKEVEGKLSKLVQKLEMYEAAIDVAHAVAAYKEAPAT